MEFRVTLPQNYRSGMTIVVQGMEIKLPPGFHAGQTVSLKMKDSGGGAPPRSSAAADGADYRSGFGVPNNPRLSDNLRFIKGVGVATQKNAYAVSDFHPPSGIFFGDYTALESMHDYIQWLFPNHASSQFNQDQHPLQRHEAETIAADPVCQQNLLLNYRCFLDFLGFTLDDEATGAVSRHSNAAERLRNLNAEGHNKLRITRVLKCFGICGLEHLKAPLVRALIEEAFPRRTLVALRDSIKTYFVGTIKDDAERVLLASQVEAYEAYYVDDPLFSDEIVALDHSTNDVGSKVFVWWHLEQQWFGGTIEGFEKYGALHIVRYDDGDVRKHRLDLFGDSVRAMAIVPMDEAPAFAAAAAAATTSPSPMTPPTNARPLGPAAPVTPSRAGPTARAPPTIMRSRSLDEAMASADGCGAISLTPVNERLQPPYPPGTAINGRFSSSAMFPGIVQSYDAVAQKYSIVFNDGDVFPAFRSIDVFQDMSAPLPGDRITLFAATKEGEQEELAFVARSAADGSWDLVNDAGVAVNVPLGTPSVPERCVAVMKAAPLPRVTMDSIAPWSTSALPLLASSSPPRAAPLVKIARERKTMMGTMREDIEIADARSVCALLTSRPAVGTNVGVFWRPSDAALASATIVRHNRKNRTKSEIVLSNGEKGPAVSFDWFVPSEFAGTRLATQAESGEAAFQRCAAIPARSRVLVYRPTASVKGANWYIGEIRSVSDPLSPYYGATGPGSSCFAPSAKLNSIVRVWQGDITHLVVDAITNAANGGLKAGGGICGAIHDAAGPELEEACFRCPELNAKTGGGASNKSNVQERKFGPQRCEVGDTRITQGYKLHARAVLHTVGPQGVDADALRAAYRSALNVARAHSLRSVAFCSISTGIFGYDIREATPVALAAVREWLSEDGNSDEMDCIIFCVFSNADRRIYESCLPSFFPIDSAEVEKFRTDAIASKDPKMQLTAP